MSPHCKYRMEINRQIGLVHVVWIWNRNLGNVVPNWANSLLCAAEMLQKTSLFLFSWYTGRLVPPDSQNATWRSLLTKAIIVLKKPIQTSAGKAVNYETEVEFCLPLEPKLINFMILFTVAVYFDNTFLSCLPQFRVMWMTEKGITATGWESRSRQIEADVTAVQD